MYESYFGLRERPFSIAPDPRYLFMSQRHKEALAHLAYGIRQGAGFVLLTGEVGTGKTTICRQILRKLPENTRLAFILNPMLNAGELLATLCDELGVDYDESHYSLKQLTDNLTRYLLDCYHHDINVVLMIDEAQNLAPDVLEQIRLLTNLETDQRKLLQIILVGQPELQHLLARKELRQLAQRVTARYHLRPLDLTETQAYIAHRLRIAGTTQSVFSSAAIKAVFQCSEGVPRLINNLCDRALMAAFGAERKTVNVKMVQLAAQEVISPTLRPATKFNLEFPNWAYPLAGVLVLLLGFWLGQTRGDSQTNSKSLVVQDNESISLSSIPSDKAQTSVDLINTDRDSVYKWILGGGAADAKGTNADNWLAIRWSLDYRASEHGEFCRFARDFRLKCESGFVSWQNLLAYDRPVNLQIENGSGEISWLTLHRLNHDQAEIETVAGKRWIKLDALLSVWNRQYKMLWQAPPGYDRPFRYGDRGEQVTWLAERIAFLYKDSSINQNSVFDEYLQDLLMDFQQRHGLNSDGIAGMNTLIQLNTSTIQGIPRLL